MILRQKKKKKYRVKCFSPTTAAPHPHAPEDRQVLAGGIAESRVASGPQ